jgi:DinB superfamily
MSTAVPYASFLGTQDPITVLEATADRLSSLTARLSPGQIAAPIAPGKWSIHQIVAHLPFTNDCLPVRRPFEARSLSSERNGRFHPRRPARRQIGSNGRSGDHHHTRAQNRNQVGPCYAEQQSLNQPANAERDG